jgi:HD superfamily phosphodiesterase
MNTVTAKRIAEKRHEVMLQFLDQFMREWDGN